MSSLARVIKAEIAIPDFSGISKRSITLPKHILVAAKEPGGNVIVDSNELKLYGKDEWHQEKHDVPCVDCFLRSMKIITFWHVNSPHLK
jgi:hypothetical protein